MEFYGFSEKIHIFLQLKMILDHYFFSCCLWSHPLCSLGLPWVTWGAPQSGFLCHLPRRLTSSCHSYVRPLFCDPGPQRCASVSQLSNWIFKLTILEFFFYKFYLVLFKSKIVVLNTLKLFLFRFYPVISSYQFQSLFPCPQVYCLLYDECITTMTAKF